MLQVLLIIPPVYASSNIVVFGDSLSAGFGLQQEQSWVSLLQQHINQNQYDYNVINASISGDTTDGGLHRLNKTLTSHKPKIVILELGGNDGLRGLNLKTMHDNLATIIDECIAHNAKVLLIGMKLPPNYGIAYTARFAEIYQMLAKEKNIPLLPFLLTGFESDMSLFQADRIHPNATAQSIILKNVWTKLEPLLHKD